MDAVDKWSAEVGPLIGAPDMTRPEALRRIATEYLTAQGFLPPR